MAKRNEEMPEIDDVEFEREYKLAQLEHMREQTAIWSRERREREEREKREQSRRERVRRDVEETERKRRAMKSRCKHLKGGKNNNFAKGQASDHSVIDNTYPTGEREILCTRCGDSAWMPTKALKKSLNAADFKAAQEKWAKWVEFITDNEPSGSQVFLAQEAA